MTNMQDQHPGSLSGCWKEVTSGSICPVTAQLGLCPWKPGGSDSWTHWLHDHVAKGELWFDYAEACHMLCQVCIWEETEANETLETAVAAATINWNGACGRPVHTTKAEGKQGQG